MLIFVFNFDKKLGNYMKKILTIAFITLASYSLSASDDSSERQRHRDCPGIHVTQFKGDKGSKLVRVKIECIVSNPDNRARQFILTATQFAELAKNMPHPACSRQFPHELKVAIAEAMLPTRGRLSQAEVTFSEYPNEFEDFVVLKESDIQTAQQELAISSQKP